MIAKCTIVALLAVLANAQPACERIALPVSGSCSPCASGVLATSGSSSDAVVIGSSSSSSSSGSFGSSGYTASGAITRNIVAKGKYPVALKNCGPTPDQQIPVTTTRHTAPVQEKPTVRLPARIPAPRTVCHTCTCYKTIVRPRVHQHIITVPSVQRYIETLHKPVIENIQYEAVPVNCEGALSSSSSSSSSSGSLNFVSVGSGSGSGCGSSVQAIQVPSFSGSCAQPVEVSVARPVEVSCSRPVEVAVARPVEVAVARPVEVSCSRPVEVSVARPVEVSYSRPVEVAVARPTEVSYSQPIETIQVPSFSSSCGQRVEIPETVSLGSSCQC